jgi:hypothetical protein
MIRNCFITAIFISLFLGACSNSKITGEIKNDLYYLRKDLLLELEDEPSEVAFPKTACKQMIKHFGLRPTQIIKWDNEKGVFEDPWQHEIKIVTHELTLGSSGKQKDRKMDIYVKIYSLGPNGIDEDGGGDDILIDNQTKF